MPTYKLYYFNAQARAETSRLMFVASGTKFEDVRLNDTTSAEIKPKTPLGQFPVLEVDNSGKYYMQSRAIERYVATVAGYYGKSPLENLEIDSIVDVIEQALWDGLFKTFREEGEKKDQAKEEYRTGKGQEILEKLNKYLSGSGGFAVGNSLTWADFAIFHGVTWVEKLLKAKFDHSKLAKLDAVCASVQKNPGVAEHLKSREDTQF